MFKKFIVVGAGPAGISAGYELQKAGFEVKIFEKSSNFHCFSSDFSSFFMLSGFPWRGKGQTPLSKQFIC